jgi:hypothetical protein
VTFANPLPWWTLLPLFAAMGLLAWHMYARTGVPLTRERRAALAALRLFTLVLLLLAVMRPVTVEPTERARDVVVPVLVDTSRSMRLPDADGRARIEVARELAAQLMPQLGQEFDTELLRFADVLTPATLNALSADGRRSELTQAVAALADRYRGRTLGGVVIVSDGGDTSGRDAARNVPAGAPPVYTIGVGATSTWRDRDVQSVTAGEARIADSSIEISASVVSHGFGRDAFDVRLFENERPVAVRRVAPAGDGMPIREVFQVAPKGDVATLYTIEVPADPDDLAPENNRRSILVRPPARPRRLLLVEGGPGHEHSFLKRALASDRNLEFDSVVRKGQNDRGEDTFYVQAATARSTSLARGYPSTREALFAYDAIFFGNVEGDFISREQLDLTADFVAERGGGLLVFGAQSFTRGGLAGTPVEDVLPVKLAARGVVRTAAATVREAYRIGLTAEGERHALMQVGDTPAEARERWDAAPALAWVAPLGVPRPGASVLAVTQTPVGVQPAIVVQRYGRGRSMVFGGEASWRWRMLLPSADRTHELFWRQIARWLSEDSADPVTTTAPRDAVSAEPTQIDVTVRDTTYTPLRDADVAVQIVGPSGATQHVRATLADGSAGRYVVGFRPDQSGVYRVQAEARRAGASVGSTEAWVLVDGAEPEFSDPRLNEEVLRRIAVATGGRYLTPNEAADVSTLLRTRAPHQTRPAVRDLWHSAWSFGLIVLLICTEWVLRRRWGLR